MNLSVGQSKEPFSVLEALRDVRVLDFMDDMVRIIDTSGTILFANERMKQFCGIDPTGISAINPDGRYVPRTIAMSTFVTEAPVISEYCMQGHVFSVKSSPIFAEERRVVAALEVFRDITIQNNITLELFEANGKMNREIELARTIQTSMLPGTRAFGPLRFDSRYIPSNQLSGDMFDIILLNRKQVALYIADVVGHGISASILTMFVRQTMRSILSEGEVFLPAAVLHELRRRFEEIALGDNQYFSLFYGYIDLENGQMTYANAGHNCPPLVYENGRFFDLNSSGQLLSTAIPYRAHKEKRLSLRPGQKILFFTDGMVETENRAGERYGRKSIERLWKQSDTDVLDRLVEDVAAYRWGKQKDDVALLLMETMEEA